MKKLLLIWFFSASLTACSQVADTNELRQYSWSRPSAGIHQNPDGSFSIKEPDTKPDTLRAIILVTMSPNGVARARMGFVVIEQGKRPVYLDCRKRALKMAQVGWGWEIVNAGNNQ